jgi:hypothetical protein
MSRLDEQSWQVVAAAQRYVRTSNPSEMREFDIATLKKTDYQLGDRDVNAGWRKAIQDFIREKENSPEVLEVKPEAFGIKLNVNELFKRALRWFRK